MTSQRLRHLRWGIWAFTGIVGGWAIDRFGYLVLLPMTVWVCLSDIIEWVKAAEADARYVEALDARARRHGPPRVLP